MVWCNNFKKFLLKRRYKLRMNSSELFSYPNEVVCELWVAYGEFQTQRPALMTNFMELSPS
jgi:hypothetical protein